MTDSPDVAGKLAHVVALHLNNGSRAPLLPVERAVGIADGGLEGDRHERAFHRPVLFMQQEVLDEFGLPPGTVREQVTVRGLDLPGLSDGDRLRVGGATLEVLGPCDPCERMDEIRPGLKDALEGRRGRFMRVVAGGPIAVDDTIVPEGAGG